MFGQRLGCLRFTVLFQIGRAGTGQLLPRQQRARHQSLVKGHLRANRQVEAVAGQVAVVVVELQLDLHLGILGRELQQQAIEEGFPERHRHRHPHRSGHVVLQSRQGLACPLDLHHQRLGLGQQRSASGGQAQAASGTLQQHHGKLRFQLADALGQLAFAATELLRRQGKTPRLDQHRERRQVIHLAHGLFPFENQRLPISALIRRKNHPKLKPRSTHTRISPHENSFDRRRRHHRFGSRQGTVATPRNHPHRSHQRRLSGGHQ
ncbi:hypothetical protein D3C80_1223720 [compost metagenome]